MMDVSVISTVFNEKDSIDSLLDSLLSQTFKPSEVVIVDGGSTDGTWERIQKWKEKFESAGIKFKAIREEGANIARGRNVAIENASSDLIASIDGGCVAHKDWLKELCRRYEETGADVVTGAYEAITGGDLEKKIARVVVPDRNRFRDGVEASSRSVLFRKEAWEKVGGYPENLYTAEDSTFNFNLKRAGFRFAYARNALVYWRMRPSLRKFAKQFFNYGKGDAKAGTFLWFFRDPKNKDARGCFYVISLTAATLLLSFIKPFFLLIAPLIFFLEGVFRSRSLGDLFYLPFLMLLKRASYLMGFLYGLFFEVIHRFSKR